jgi:hypothetical protein
VDTPVSLRSAVEQLLVATLVSELRSKVLGNTHLSISEDGRRKMHAALDSTTSITDAGQRLGEFWHEFDGFASSDTGRGQLAELCLQACLPKLKRAVGPELNHLAVDWGTIEPVLKVSFAEGTASKGDLTAVEAALVKTLADALRRVLAASPRLAETDVLRAVRDDIDHRLSTANTAEDVVDSLGACCAQLGERARELLSEAAESAGAAAAAVLEHATPQAVDGDPRAPCKRSALRGNSKVLPARSGADEAAASAVAEMVDV